MLHADKNEETENEKWLVRTVGESIRDMALQRSGGGAEVKGDGGSARKKRCRQQEGTLSNEVFTSFVLPQAENCREAEKKRLNLESNYLISSVSEWKRTLRTLRLFKVR